MFSNVESFSMQLWWYSFQQYVFTSKIHYCPFVPHQRDGRETAESH